MYELEEENYKTAEKIYGKELDKKPFGKAIKDKITPFFVVYEDNKRITNFIVYKNDDNWLAFDREIINNQKLMSFILDKLQTKYDYLTIYLSEKDKELITKANDYNFLKQDQKRQNYIKMRKDY